MWYFYRFNLYQSDFLKKKLCFYAAWYRLSEDSLYSSLYRGCFRDKHNAFSGALYRLESVFGAVWPVQVSFGANHIYKKRKNKQLGAAARKKNDYFVRRKAESLNPNYR